MTGKEIGDMHFMAIIEETIVLDSGKDSGDTGLHLLVSKPR